jgi:cell division septation protein DedD
MNRNVRGGLVALAAMIIVAVVLWWLYHAIAPRVGPGPVATSKPAVTPPLAPKAEQAAPQGPGAAPGIKPETPGGVAPLQGPSPAEPQITIPPPPARGKKYGVLVGNYRKYPQAARMLGRLKKRGIPGFVQRNPRDSSQFQVWMGPFSSQEEAQAAEKKLRAKRKKPLKIEEIENPVPK